MGAEVDFRPARARGSPPAEEADGEVLEATVARVVWSGDGFAILGLEGGGVAVGEMPRPAVGMRYRLEGAWKVHPRHGRQFAFDLHSPLAPTRGEAVAAYLAEHCPWVGPAISRQLVVLYGERALDVLGDDPDRVAREVRGVTPGRAREASGALLKLRRAQKLMVDLKHLFAGIRVPRRSVAAVAKLWGDQAIDKVRENPYRLVDLVDGIGFLTADAVGARLGRDALGAERIRAGVVHALREAADVQGHTCLPPAELVARAADRKVLDVPRARVEARVAAMVKDGNLAEHGGKLYLPGVLACEAGAARELLRLASSPPPPSDPMVDGLADDQAAALRVCCRSQVFLLTGCPGTGKSFCCRSIIDSHPGSRAVLCAPTGKAAKRLSEHTGRQAVTIHKLLEAAPRDGKFEFTRDRENPVEADLVLVDESSMVDVRLFRSLLSALRDGTKLVLVGDVHQLPPVAHGNVLRDAIACGRFPHAELDTIKRQEKKGGQIVRSCHSIKNSGGIVTDGGRDADLFFMERRDPDEARKLIVELASRRLPEAYGLDPARDVQVISPIKRGPLGRDALNEAIRRELNPLGASGGRKLDLGDKVLQGRNSYQLGIVNGDFGKIIANEDGVLTVAFDAPPREVGVPAKDNDLLLAWACTCHKMQGSEFPTIVMPVHKCLGSFLGIRSMLYTGISRASRVCVLVGQRTEVGRWVRRNRQLKRHTGLELMLREGPPDA